MKKSYILPASDVQQFAVQQNICIISVDSDELNYGGEGDEDPI